MKKPRIEIKNMEDLSSNLKHLPTAAIKVGRGGNDVQIGEAREGNSMEYIYAVFIMNDLMGFVDKDKVVEMLTLGLGKISLRSIRVERYKLNHLTGEKKIVTAMVDVL